MQLNPAKLARPVHADGRRYVPAIDGLRCLAAFGVISAHIGSQFGPTKNLVSYYGSAAYPSLIVFFTISGFLIYRPFARSALAPRSTPKTDRSTNFWVYILRRVLRIFPLYWAVLAVTVAAQGAGGLEGLTDWVQAIFLLPFPHPTHLLRGPLGIAMWTLAIELPFYVLVPLYASGVKALRRRYARRMDPFHVQLAAVFTVLAVIFTLGIALGGELAFPVMSLPTGMAFAILETRQSINRRRYPVIKLLSDNWWFCLVAYVGLVFLGARLALDAFERPGVTDPFDAIRSTYFPIQMTQALLLFIPVAFGARRRLFVRFMAAAPLQLLAPLTYGVYLWHVPVVRYTQDWFGRGFLGFPFPGTRGFGMPTLFISIGLAIATFVLVELPASKLRDAIDRWSRGGRRPPPEVGGTTEFEEVAIDGAHERAVVDTTTETDDVPAPARRVTAGATAAGRPRSALVAEAAPARVRTPSPGPTNRSNATTQLATPWCQPIDGFRAISVSLAVMGHTFLAAAIYPFPGALHVLGIVVALFFAISAYVLYQPFLEADVRRLPRPRAGTFYLRRLLRIYPLFALALTTYLLVLPSVRPDGWWAYARLYLLLQIFGSELAEHFRGLPSAWYLCNEVIFYLSMPLLAAGAARWSVRRRLRTPAERLRAHLAIGWGMVFLGPLTRTMLYASGVPAPGFLPLSHLEFFGFGIVIAGYAVGTRLGLEPPAPFRWLRDHTSAAYALMLIPVALLLSIAWAYGDGRLEWTTGSMDDRLRFYPYLLAVVLLMSAAGLGSSREPTNRFLSSWWLKPLSGLALHIYLWHQLVLGIMNRAFGGIDKVDLGPRWLTGAVLVLIAWTGSVLVARASQPLTDWPYEKYRAAKGRLRGRAAAPQPRRLRPERPRILEPHPS